MLCTCGNKMDLSFRLIGVNEGRFYWQCTEHEVCKNSFEYIISENRFDFVNADPIPLLKNFDQKSASEKELIVYEIRAQTVEVLIHFIQCTWGAHYNTQFEWVIKPFLCDVPALDFVLKSRVILENKSNVIIGITGAKIYPGLWDYLMRVDNEKIKDYLRIEFGRVIKHCSYQA